MKYGIVHLLILICFAACLYGCRSHRTVTRETVTEATREEKQTTIGGVIELTGRDSIYDKHTLLIHQEDSTHIRIDYDSLGRIKGIDFSNRKTEKRAGENQGKSYYEKTTSQQETAITRKSNIKCQSQEKEKATNGGSLWSFLKFMFFFLSFCLVHDNWSRIKNFVRRIWKK